MTKTKNKFENDLIDCRIGVYTITANNAGIIESVHNGRKMRDGVCAIEYVYARPELRKQFEAWWQWRHDEISKWKHETPHHRYATDRGALALRVNGVRVLVGNRHGDGDFPVYINAENLPPTFHFSGTSIDGPCSVEILDYDCDGANVIETIDIADGKSMVVLVESGCTGAVAVAVS